MKDPAVELEAALFLQFVLDHPAKSEQLNGEIWASWLKQWLEDQRCDGVEVSVDPEDPGEVRARFRVGGLPNRDSLITVPVEGTPFEIHIVSKMHTGCGFKADADKET